MKGEGYIQVVRRSLAGEVASHNSWSLGDSRSHGTAQPIGANPVKKQSRTLRHLPPQALFPFQLDHMKEKRTTYLIHFPMSYCSCGGRTLGRHQSGLFLRAVLHGGFAQGVQRDASQGTAKIWALQMALDGTLNGGTPWGLCQTVQLKNSPFLA
jgi:hypothetical protein